MTSGPCTLSTSTALAPCKPGSAPISSLEAATNEVVRHALEVAKFESGHLPAFGQKWKGYEIEQLSYCMKVSPPSPAIDDPHFLIPPLTGKYRVGVRAYSANGLLIDVHYPGQPRDNPVNKVHPLSTGRHPMNIENSDPSVKEKMSNLWTRSEPGLNPVKEKFPVVFFSHGSSTNQYDYQNIVEELASYGYCVVTISHPSSDNSSPFAKLDPSRDPMPTEEKFMEALREGAEDVQAVLALIRDNRIEGFGAFLGESINTDSIGVLGHSLGGGTALKTCIETKLVKAGIDLDGCTVREDKIVFEQPFLTIASGKGGLWSPGEEYYEDWKKCHTKSSELIVLEEAGHMDFAINPLFEAKKKNESNKVFLGINQQVNQLIVSFFNKHLKNQ